MTYINDDLEVLKILLDHFGPQQLAKIIIDGEFGFLKLQNNLSNAKLILKLFLETFDASEYCEFWNKFSLKIDLILEVYFWEAEMDSEFLEILWTVGETNQIEIFNFKFFCDITTQQIEPGVISNQIREKNIKLFTEFLKTQKILVNCLLIQTT